MNEAETRAELIDPKLKACGVNISQKIMEYFSPAVQLGITATIYTSDDTIIEGEIEQGKLYTEPDFNKIIEIKIQ